MSIVKCIPEDGRTHQIRVHLHWLGFPIVNDPLYGPIKTHSLSQSNRNIIKSKEEIEQEGGDPICPFCIQPFMVNKPGVDEEENGDHLCIWLHAWTYEGNNWKYETELPSWTKQ